MSFESVNMTTLKHSLAAFPRVKKFIEIAERLCQPDRVVLFPGTAEAYAEICRLCRDKGAFIPLNDRLHPNSYLVRSSPRDVARTESRTFICGDPDEPPLYPPHMRNLKEDCPDLGFSWGCFQGEWDPEMKRELTSNEMREVLYGRFRGCMRGRTMYVIPFSMGPVGSPFTKLGIELTDSPYVVANMYIMTRTGNPVLELMRNDQRGFLPCWHSVGAPLQPGEKDVPWPWCGVDNLKTICHFMHRDTSETGHGMGIHELGDYAVMSYGSGYGGNALLGKKCFALRVGSCMAKKNDWMAEHMLILHVTHQKKGLDDQGRPYAPRHFYLTGAFPSACGKTNLAMLQVPPEFVDEWSVTTLGDDIAWLRVIDGKLHAINPETGFFGVAPGTSYHSNPNAMDTMMQGNTIYTNCAVTLDGQIWWGEMTSQPPPVLVDWKGHIINTQGQHLSKEQLKKIHKEAAWKNSRYTTPVSQCPCLDREWNAPNGVPIDAILFGGRRCSTIPLAYKSFGWDHGVLLAACMRSEQTAAVQDRPEGSLNYDPMAMRPFIGYNYGQYFAHWIRMGAKMTDQARPDIYSVNWFRREGDDIKGNFLWPGFSQNFRVIRWICENAWARRTSNLPPPSTSSPIGVFPTEEFLCDPGNGNLAEDAPRSVAAELLTVDKEKWLEETAAYDRFLEIFSGTCPRRLLEEQILLKERLRSYESESEE
eukprot:gnl/Trimastix_PCT/376.p2 GENE.gnl/Trimastix_PCT/376~~gnl/Trimastix_PCT/376.p2  ORF type:complete len:704 (+),score=244.99 gnl/Trimastix_PCT/376:93-2204(+)